MPSLILLLILILAEQHQSGTPTRSQKENEISTHSDRLHTEGIYRSLSLSFDLFIEPSHAMTPWNQQLSCNNDDSKHDRAHDTNRDQQPSSARTRLPHHQHHDINSNYNALLFNNNNIAALSVSATSISSRAVVEEYGRLSSFSTSSTTSAFSNSPFPYASPYRQPYTHPHQPSSLRPLPYYTGYVLGKRGNQRYVRDSRPRKRRCQSRNVHATKNVANEAEEDVEMDEGGK